MRTKAFLVLLGIFSCLTNPGKQAFLARTNPSTIFQKVYQTILQKEDAVEYHNYLLFSIVRLHTYKTFEPQITTTTYLGLWTRFIQLLPPPETHSMYSYLHSLNQCACRNGICTLESNCICLPSWTGPSCDIPINNFISLSTLTKPLSRNFNTLVQSLPLPISQTYSLLPSITFLDTIGPLEVILFLNILIYLLWKLQPEITMEQYFTVSYKNSLHRPISLLLGQNSHASLQHLVNNMYAFYVYAPIIYSLMGVQSFLLLYITCIVSTAVVGLLWKRVSLFDGVWRRSLGASGWILGMRTWYALYEHQNVVNSTSSFIFSSKLLHQPSIQQHILGFVLLDLMTGHNVDVAGHIGGILGGIGFFVLNQNFY